MIKYKTIMKEGEIQQVIERSKFIACVRPVESRDEADAFIAERRTLFKDATHNVPAFVIGEKNRLQWASDDGEPQGTSGAPIVQMMEAEGLTNLVAVVTRYFGGTKLGTGGLVRAYTGAAREAIYKAGLYYAREDVLLGFSMDYTFLGKLQNMSLGGLFRIMDTEYSDKVLVTLAAESSHEEDVVGLVKNLTSGSEIQNFRRLEVVKVPI
ncbi:YigZ family protein [Clostridia bacterium]|nr:YigZ family protein [Clostridia bacterium]